MKKYVKPALIVERYELSQSIAACAWDLDFDSNQSCQAIPDKDFFGSSYNGTMFTEQPRCTYVFDEGYEDYCYQNGGSSPFSVFRS